MANNANRKREIDYARFADLEHQIDALRRNPLVRLGTLLDWSHLRRGLARLGKGLLTLIIVAAAISEILRFALITDLATLAAQSVALSAIHGRTRPAAIGSTSTLHECGAQHLGL